MYPFITIIVYKGVNLNVDILDYLQVKIKKNVNTLKESMMKRLNENEFIENNKNTVDDDLGNVESATDDAATMEILLEHAKKRFLSCKFCFY